MSLTERDQMRLAVELGGWRAAHAERLRELHGIVAGWPHVQHDYRPTFERSHPAAARFERWAPQLAIALLLAAEEVAEPAPLARESALAHLGEALVHLHAVPAFSLSLATDRGARPDARASVLVAELLESARVACTLAMARGAIGDA